MACNHLPNSLVGLAIHWRRVDFGVIELVVVGPGKLFAFGARSDSYADFQPLHLLGFGCGRGAPLTAGSFSIAEKVLLFFELRLNIIFAL